MHRKLLALTAAVAVLATVFLASPATAQTAELHNSTYDVDADTDALRVVAENITNDTATVEFVERLDGNESTVRTATLNTSTSSMDSVELSTIDANATYRVLVTGDGAASLTVNEVTVEAAGAGGATGSDLSINSLNDTQKVAVGGAVVFFTVATLLVVCRPRLSRWF